MLAEASKRALPLAALLLLSCQSNSPAQNADLETSVSMLSYAYFFDFFTTASAPIIIAY